MNVTIIYALGTEDKTEVPLGDSECATHSQSRMRSSWKMTAGGWSRSELCTLMVVQSWPWQHPFILAVDAGRNLIREFSHPDEGGAPWPGTLTK